MARNNCPHLDNILQTSPAELCTLKKGIPCASCDAIGPNLWVCLKKNCLHIGCSDKDSDHSTSHFEYNRAHCIQMNLSSQRVWCYLCESEIFLQASHSNQFNRYHSHQRPTTMDDHRMFQDKGGGGESIRSDSSDYDDDDFDGELNGLVGLKNIANTCYMNSALQALSNSPPLTGYFLECGNLVENNFSRPKPQIAKSYHRLIKDMWCKKRRNNGYVIPKEILHGISSVHPMFRGFQQHDTQEFLRCFMDQLHEELKEITPPQPQQLTRPPSSINDDEDMCEEFSPSPCPSPSPSQSEAEYETCDSGVSEQSSLSDEISINIKHNRNTRSPSPTITSTASSLNQRQSSLQHNNSMLPTTSSTTPSPPPVVTQRLLKSSGSSASLTSQSSLKSKDTFVNSTGNQNQPQQKFHRSIISDIFDGKLLSSVQCLTCDRVSTREETFQDLSLPIPGKDHLAALHHQSQGPPHIIKNPNATCTDVVYQVQDSWMWWIWGWFRSFFWGPAVTIHDCLGAFFSADELKGDNMYSCEKCNKLRNGVKFSRVLALPEMLCVHLKRFRHDLSYSSKISSPVLFPLSGLDMRQYLHKDCKSKISMYDLSAVICHHGTVGSGHYICFAKHHPSERWFEYDDQLVTQVSAETVQNCEAYVLFYRKNNAQMTTIRNQAQDIVNANINPSSDIEFYVSKQWLNRYHTFAEPGPIDNWSILCPHGNLLPNKTAINLDLLVPLPQTLWEFLYDRFGGGPVCNRPIECDTCKTAAESLMRRQKVELAAFSELRDEFQYQDNTSMLFAISMTWFRRWQAFARTETTEEPGPINNTMIAQQSDTLPMRNVRQGSDYAQINLKLWKFFYSIYGGGPEIVLRGACELAKIDQSEMEQSTENLSINEEPIPLPSPPVASPTSVEQTKTIKDSENETKYQERQSEKEINNNSTTNSTSILKSVKTVSFEDTNDIQSSSDDEDKINSNFLDNKTIKNHQNEHKNGDNVGTTKKITATGKPLEVGNRYEKRHHHHRSTKNNGMFGAEGKYSNYSYNTIPDDASTSINNNHQQTPFKNGEKAEDNDEEVSLKMDSRNVIENGHTGHSSGHHHRSGKKKSKSLKIKFPKKSTRNDEKMET